MAALCLTAEDCTKLLSNVKSKRDYCTLSNFSLKPFSAEIRGYLGSHLLLTLEVETEKQECKRLNFFVKTLKIAPGLSSCFSDQNFFDKEVFLYKFLDTIRSTLHADVDVGPKLCYHTADDTIVLENLTESGYKPYESLKFDYAHMLRALGVLAKFHALSIAYEEHMSAKMGRKYELYEDYAEFFNTIFSEDVKSSGYKYVKSCEIGAMELIDIVYGTEGAEFKRKLAKFVPEFLALLNRPNAYRKVLTHGDLWSFNALFKYEDGEPIDCKLIDFQLLRYAPPAHDVTMVMYLCSTPKMYQDHVHDFYDYYYESFGSELRKFDLDADVILPREEFDETCKLYTPCAKFIWLCYRQTSSANEEYMETVSRDVEAHKSVVIGEGRADFVRYNYENFADYREILSTIIEGNRMTLMHEHVTIEDCFKIIKQTLAHDEYEIIDYRLKMMDGKNGFLGEYYHLTVDVKVSEIVTPMYYFVKLTPSQAPAKEFLESTGGDFKERQFFNHVVPNLTNHGADIILDVVPKIYICNTHMMIMDDLKTKGYTIINVREPMSSDQLKFGITSLAKFHASAIIFEETTGLKLNEVYPKEFTETFYTSTNQQSVNLLKAGKLGIAEQIKTFSDYTTSITPEQFLKLACDFVNELPTSTHPSSKYRNTMCHGDLWAHNIMFNLEKGDAILIDFQSYRYKPPAHDLMQFVYFSSNRMQRVQHMREYLDYYYDEFGKYLAQGGCDVKDVLSYGDFLKSCEEEKKFAITQCVTHFQNILVSPERLATFLADEEFSKKALFEDRSEHIRNNLAEDPIYRQRSEESIIDLRNLCEKFATLKLKY